MYPSILVPLDGSTFGEHALPLALSIARRAKSELHLLHVHTPLSAIYAEGAFAIDEQLEHSLKEQQKAYLNDVVRRIKGSGEVRIRPILREGPVVPMIRATAESTGAGLVVMTTHGRGALARFWLGSVADQLVRDLAAPLLLVRPGEAAAEFGTDPVLKHLLLPLDGSALAEQMIEPAVALGSLMGAEYTLLRVIRPALPTPAVTDGAGLTLWVQSMSEQMEKLAAEVRKEARGYLEQVADRLRARSLRVQTRIALEDQPAAAILHAAAAPPGVDAVALETHGRRGLARLFLGSVADKVVRGAPVPVLVHRPLHP
jgi:nucleotide-binding universal stress UspA family protein